MTSPEAPGSLGAVIRQRRSELGWSQEELAARVSDEGDEVRQSDISRLERGRVGLPRRARLLRLAAVLGLAPGDLLARSGWAGADRAMPGAAPPPARREAEAKPRPVEHPAPAGLGTSWVLTAGAETADRLRSAIDRAEATRAESERVLRRAGEVLALAENPRERAASRPPEDGCGCAGAEDGGCRGQVGR